MRIAVLVHSLVRAGGIAKHTLRASVEYAGLGHDVTVWAMAYDRENCYPELAHRLEIRSLGAQRQTAAETYLFRSRLVAMLWRRWQLYLDSKRLSLLISGDYDVIHPNGNEIIWTAAEHKRRHGTAVVWMCNDFWPLSGAAPKYSLKRRSNLGHLARSTLLLPLDRYDRSAVHAADRIAVLSERVRDQMRGHYGVESSVIRAGVDTPRPASTNGEAARTRLRRRLGIPETSFVLLTLSVLMPRRRLEDVIGAIRLLVEEGLDVRYLIAGRTSHRPDYAAFLRAEASELGVADRVMFAGEVPESELADYYEACDAFVWASDENQSWGLAPMEAMATGRPVIVSRANGLAEVLEDDKSALLVASRSPSDVADAVRRLMESPLFAAGIGRNARELVRTSYSWRSNAEKMLRLFAEAQGKSLDGQAAEPASRAVAD